MLASPEISVEDKIALEAVCEPEVRTRVLQQIADKILLEILEARNSQDVRAELDAQTCMLAWLIVHDRLQLKFAFPKHVSNPGIFHEKIGVFTFPSGDVIAFTGSANETTGGHQRNYETLDVFRSWLPEDVGRVRRKAEQFEEAWSGQAPGLEVCVLSTEVLAKLTAVAARYQVPSGQVDSASHKWRHQTEAMEAFLAAKHGVLEMATGTGKTRTALRILHRLWMDGAIESAIVSTDGVDLLDQWREELDKWRTSPGLPPLRILRHYRTYRESAKFVINPSSAVMVVSRGTLPDLLNQIPRDQRSKIAIVHDEVHGMGSEVIRSKLENQHQSFVYRLGLSATPEREYDEEGSQFILDELGDVVFRFGLEDAIERGILAPFNYVPLEYELTKRDNARLQAVRSKEAARRKAGNPMTKEELWIELSRVYKTAEMKPEIFKDYVSRHPEVLRGCIVFVEDREFAVPVLSIIHFHTHKYRTYYAEDDRQNLVDFANGKLDCLITCHRISQGIDIRDLRNVVLFSAARAKLETIQRIGRCIRSDPNDPDKTATVVDFVRPLQEGDLTTNADQSRSDWLTYLSRIRRGEA